MTNPTLDALIAARGYVEQGWTQGEHARLASGVATNPRDPLAVCWCAAGAIWLATGSILSVEDYLGPLISPAYVADWNDAPGRTKDEVLALFDRAIEAQSSKGGQ